MDRPLLMAIVLVFLLLLLGLMLLGWRRRQRSQANLPRPSRPPKDAGPELARAAVFYVATTMAGEPLNRIAVAGLGYRARATVAVSEAGVTLAIPGEDAIFIPAGDIRAVDRATWTIDRAVEQDGLVLVRWALPGDAVSRTEVDSYLRVIDPAEAGHFFSSVQHLHGNDTQTGGRAQ